MEKTSIASNAWNAFSKEKNDLLGGVFSRRQWSMSELESAVSSLYENVGAQPRYVVVANGPAEALAFMKEHDSQDTSLRKQNLADHLFSLAVKSAQSTREQLATSLHGEDYTALRNMFFWDLNFQVSQSFAEPVFVELSKSSDLAALAKYRKANNPSVSDLDWIGLHHVARKILGLPADLPQGMADFIFNGGMQLYAFDQLAVAIVTPAYISRDESFRLHGEGEAAVTWKDGTKLYFHNGVPVPEKLVESPDQITREDIMAEHNAEVRRCYQEIMGSERFAHMLGLQVIDAQHDRLGHEIKLFKTEYKDKLAGDYIFFAQVVCPSTRRRYFLCVPPTVRTAAEAVAWTFGKSVDEYRPEIET